MEVFFEAGSRNRFEQMDYEAQDAVRNAIILTRDKNGYSHHSGIYRNCRLEVTFGHNIYTTRIEICPIGNRNLERAFYWNGAFYEGLSKRRVELI